MAMYKLGALAICILFLLALRNVAGYSNNRHSALHSLQSPRLAASSAMHSADCGYTAVMIVPTGIGAAIGGYAGDALPSARLISSCVDTLVTHPNVLNGAMMYWPLENALYVEGYALDEFASGSIGLVPTKKKAQKIGLLLDSGIEEHIRLRHLQVADAARATLGIDVTAVELTPEPVGVTTSLTESGASWGSIRSPEALVRGAESLLRKGCTAIAVVARFPEEEEKGGEEGMSGGYDAELFNAYREGEGVDAIAGVEALISHVITKKLGVPCAHAPAFDMRQAGYEPYPNTAPKACAEELGYTFLPCVIANLRRAPSLVPLPLPLSQSDKSQSDSVASESDVDSVTGAGLGMSFHAGLEGGAMAMGAITAADVDAVVVPSTALGGPAVLALAARGVLVVAVEENTSSMQTPVEALLGLGVGVGNGGVALKKEGGVGPLVSGLQTYVWGKSKVVVARSYAEAAGILVAHKNGILLESLSASVSPLR